MIEACAPEEYNIRNSVIGAMMEDHERERLAAIADQAARTIYDALTDALNLARTDLFNARLKSDIGGPELIKQREQELAQAKERLRAWATANPSAGYHLRIANGNHQRQISELALQIGAAAEAAVRNR